MNRKQAGHSLHHHLAHVVFGLADQRDARSGIGRNAAHPFGAGARLARAAATENEPGEPLRAAVGAFRRALMTVRQTRKVATRRFIPPAIQAQPEAGERRFVLELR